MTSERLADKATNSLELKLERFDEFVGVGVVPVRPHSKDMVVAVYVSKPPQNLSPAFKARVPVEVVVFEGGKRIRVATKIVNVGELCPG